MASESTVTVVTIAQTIPIRLLPRSGGPSALALAGAEVSEREADEEQHEEQDGRHHRDEHGVVEHLPGGLDAPVPGRDLRPEEDRDDRREDDARDEPEDQEAAAVAVRGRGRCGGGRVS